MPVFRFRSVEAIGETLQFAKGDPAAFRALRQLLEIVGELSPVEPFPPGVRKYRSIEEAWADRQAWEFASATRRSQATKPE